MKRRNFNFILRCGCGLLSILLTVTLFAGCAPVVSTDLSVPYTPAQILSSVSVTQGREGKNLYQQNGDYFLYVDERNAVFSVGDSSGHMWHSVPENYANDSQASGGSVKLLGSLVQLHYTDRLGNINILNSRADSVEAGTADVQRINGGVRFLFRFEKYGFIVPVDVILRSDGVEVSLVTSGVVEAMEGFQLLSVDVAPYFAAAHQEEDGYLLVPDGSGAVIEWKNNIGSSVEYSQYLYGRDGSITQMDLISQTESARLPVFGMNRKGNGFTAIVTQGAARAKVNATVAGKRNSYSNVYAEFIYRDNDLVMVEKKAQTVRIIETMHTQAPVQTVRYLLSSQQEHTYVDMARDYREYLTEELKIQPTTNQDYAPLVIEFYGGVMAQQYIMGFPVDQVLSLTTYQDASDIITKLKNAGIDQLTVNFLQWQLDGTGAAIQKTLRPESQLGGNGKLKALLALCKEQGVGIYLNANTNRMVKSAPGYHKKNDAASSVRWEPAMQYHYDVNTGEARVSSPSFYLTPSKVLGLAQSYAKSAAKYEMAGLSSDILGNVLYSDFDKNGITRDQTQIIWQKTLEALAEGERKLMVSGGNAYVFGYADIITDVPMTDSSYLMETRSVPFYQIALHGLVTMTTTSLNDSTDVRLAFLKAVETGTCLKWAWIARNEDDLVETDYNSLISCRYENWFDTAVEQYREASKLLQSLATCTVTDHGQVMPGVMKTLWSDGTVVYTNYNSEAVTVGGVTIQAMSFYAAKEVA